MWQECFPRSYIYFSIVKLYYIWWWTLKIGPYNLTSNIHCSIIYLFLYFLQMLIWRFYIRVKPFRQRCVLNKYTLISYLVIILQLLFFAYISHVGNAVNAVVTITIHIGKFWINYYESRSISNCFKFGNVDSFSFWPILILRLKLFWKPSAIILVMNLGSLLPVLLEINFGMVC